MYKTFFALLCVFLTLITKTFALSAQSSILIDADSGRVLMDDNAYIKRGMASTTKIMTAIIALEYGKLDDIVTVSNNASKVEGSSMWLKPGEKIPLESLLYGLMLNSGNDAATAIAEYIGGSNEGFAKLMNEKVKSLGLKDTHFVNPHGLDNKEHYTTAYDLAQITRYALNNEEFAKIVSSKTKRITSEDETYSRTLKNHNRMLTIYDNADGVKTGFTKKCGRCLVSSATRDGLKLIAVTLNAPDDWKDHTEMLDFGFSKFSRDIIINKNDFIKTVLVNNGTTDNISLISDRTVAVAVADNDNIELKYNIKDYIKAPIVKGQAVGSVIVMLNGKKITEFNAIASNGVSRKICVRFYDNLYYLVMDLLSNFAKA